MDVFFKVLPDLSPTNALIGACVIGIFIIQKVLFRFLDVKEKLKR